MTFLVDRVTIEHSETNLNKATQVIHILWPSHHAKLMLQL